MTHKETISGIAVELFAKPATAEELAWVVAGWSSTEQALFFGELANALAQKCGRSRVNHQLCFIADAIRKDEEQQGLPDASEMINDLAWFLKHKGEQSSRVQESKTV